MSGQGDLQLFDISSWLEGQYNSSIELKDYFSVLGNAEALAFHLRSLLVVPSLMLMERLLKIRSNNLAL
ncbi:hypothetical protein L3081_19940 [Colwellia sp. MSW7]|uniref:Uncharacterized protein n=1 Tax=Colwellia maritima TaxID=2912588 RepID=A0ABS9X4R4_9GAMM|nr:hypothetical protein [Colwellia maritima]MCI2285230.1 hypothetical protein [Colwellia maritima]